jgi:chromosome segregation ATPase
MTYDTAMSAIETYEAEVFSLRERLQKAEARIAELEDANATLQCSDFDWQQRAEKAEAEVERLRGGLLKIAHDAGDCADDTIWLSMTETLHDRLCWLLDMQIEDIDAAREEK